MATAFIELSHITRATQHDVQYKAAILQAGLHHEACCPDGNVEHSTGSGNVGTSHQFLEAPSQTTKAECGWSTRSVQRDAIEQTNLPTCVAP